MSITFIRIIEILLLTFVNVLLTSRGIEGELMAHSLLVVFLLVFWETPAIMRIDRIDRIDR